MLEAFAESSRVKLWVFNSVSWGRLGYSWHCNLPVHVLHIIAFARFIKIHPLRLSSHWEHTRDFDLDRRTPGSPGDETQLLTPGMNLCCRVGLGKKKCVAGKPQGKAFVKCIEASFAMGGVGTRKDGARI